MEAKLIVWYGLAGAGKSYNVKETADELRAQGHDPLEIHDFMMGAGSDFNTSPRYEELVNALKQPRIAVIADVQFSFDEFRSKAFEQLRDRVPEVKIDWYGMNCSTREAAATCILDACFRAVQCQERVASLKDEVTAILGQYADFSHRGDAKTRDVFPAWIQSAQRSEDLEDPRKVSTDASAISQPLD